MTTRLALAAAGLQQRPEAGHPPAGLAGDAHVGHVEPLQGDDVPVPQSFERAAAHPVVGEQAVGVGHLAVEGAIPASRIAAPSNRRFSRVSSSRRLAPSAPSPDDIRDYATTGGN